MSGKKRLVVLSGAGISAESGLGTFRETGGLWEQYNIEDVATPNAWHKNPELVTHFYNLRRKQAYEAQPNKAHQILTELENHFDVHIITQNIDNLHERAGSSNVIHLHGEISKVKSSGPNSEKAYYDQKEWEVKMGDLCPEGYQLRPHVVWFGEAVPMMDEAEKVAAQADLFLVVGTSLNVYPAANIIYYIPRNIPCYLIDPNEVNVPTHFKLIKAKGSEGMEALKNELVEV